MGRPPDEGPVEHLSVSAAVWHVAERTRGVDMRGSDRMRVILVEGFHR